MQALFLKQLFSKFTPNGKPVSIHTKIQLGMMAPTCNPNTQEADTGHSTRKLKDSLGYG